MALDIGELLKAMLEAAKKELEEVWPDIKESAEVQFNNLLSTAELIARLRLENKISETQMKLMMESQKNTVQIALEGIKGLGKVAAQRAINAAINVVKETVNTAIGFVLL